MKLYEKGPDYAEVQRDCNYRHSDGQIETAGEWDAAGDLASKLDKLLDTKPRYILVLGCRTGYETEVLADKFDAVVVGVDIVSEFIATACRRTPAMVADMHMLSLPDNSFDLVVSIGTLEHCYAPDRAVAEIYRVVRSHVFITADLEEDRGAYGSHYAFEPDPNVWLKMYKDAGFRIMHSELSDGSRSKGLHCLLAKQEK